MENILFCIRKIQVALWIFVVVLFCQYGLPVLAQSNSHNLPDTMGKKTDISQALLSNSKTKENICRILTGNFYVGNYDCQTGNIGFTKTDEGLGQVDFGWAFASITGLFPDLFGMHIPWDKQVLADHDGVGPTNHFNDYPAVIQ